MSRKVFVLDKKLSITDDDIEGILERTVTKQGTSAKADVPRRYLGKRVYVIITKSEGGSRTRIVCHTRTIQNIFR